MENNKVKFRILEYEFGYRIQRGKKKPKKFFEKLFKLKECDQYEWTTISTNGVGMSVHSAFSNEVFDFKSKAECLKWIEDFNKYPIVHYID